MIKKTINVKKDNLIIKGSGSSKATLNVKGDDSRAFVINGKNIHLENLIFKNMNSDKFGIVLVNNTNCQIVNCEFIDNTGHSGGIFINDQAEYTTIKNCIFTNNIAKYESESGGQLGGAIDTHASHTSILNSKFDKNSAGDNGGAIYFTRGTDNLVENCEFTNNKAQNGGAIYITSTSSVQVKNSNFKNNEANYGGAIYNNDILNIENSFFTNNVANYGGAIYNDGTLNSKNCQYDSNKAKSTLHINAPSSVIWGNEVTVRVIFEGGNNIINAIWSYNPITLNDKSVNPNNKIPSQIINLNIGGKSYSAVTGNDGVAVFKFNANTFQSGKYYGATSFGNSKNYADSTQGFDLTITDKIEYKTELKNKKKIKKKQKKIQVYQPKEKYKYVDYQITYYLIPDGGGMSHFYDSISGTNKKIRYYIYHWKNVKKKDFKSKSKYKWLKSRYYYVTHYKATKIVSKWVNGKKISSQTTKNYKFTKKSKYKNIRTTDWSLYILPSVDCESDNNKIKKLSKKIIATEEKKLKKKYKKNIKLKDKQKANAILHWVQIKIKYDGYGNTRKGALKTLKDKKGNCVDSTHLTIALLRAAGIPAKYEAKYVNKKGGHAWPLAYFNGKWYPGEATEDERVDFGKSSYTNGWVKSPALPDTYINSYKYSQKFVQYGPNKIWLGIFEVHLINDKWLTYYVLSGYADTTNKNINLNKIKIITDGGSTV